VVQQIDAAAMSLDYPKTALKVRPRRKYSRPKVQYPRLGFERWVLEENFSRTAFDPSAAQEVPRG